jgi:hypothetical protein
MKLWTSLGILTCLAGLAVALLTPRPKDSLKSREASLCQSLSTPTGADQLHGNEQSLFVSLSHVRSADAGALFRHCIVPALETSTDANIIQESDSLLRRWSIPPTLSVRERSALAAKLVDRMYEENGRDALYALSAVLAEIAPGVNNADKLSQRLLQRISHDHDERSREALISGLVALEQKSTLIDLLLEERDPYGLQILSRSAADFEKSLTPAQAGELARKLIKRLSGEANPLAVEAIELLLEPLQTKLSAAETSEVAASLVERSIWESSSATIEVLMSGLAVFARNLDPETSSKLATRIAARLDSEPSPEIVAIFASGLGGLAPKADRKVLEATAVHLVSRVAEEDDPADVVSLAQALASLKQYAGQPNIAQAATIIVHRMIAERKIETMVTFSAAVEKLDGEVHQQESEALGEAIVNRIAAESNRTAILPLAMALDAVDEGIRPPVAEGLVEKLLARMRTEQDPEALRALAVGMRFLEDKTSAAKYEEAAAILVRAMQKNPDAQRVLAFGLHSFVAKASASPFEQAADLLIVKPDVEGLEAIKYRVRPDQMDHATSLLVDRILSQTSPEAIHSLTLDLQALEDRANNGSELAARLLARMPKEPFKKVLAILPLTAAQIAQIDSPCEMVLQVKAADRLPLIARELQNPACSEPAWISLASAFGAVRGSAPKQSAEIDFDGMGALKDDDDDQGTAKPGPADPLRVDFNGLSRELDQYRSSETSWLWQVLVLMGLSAIVYGWIRRPV